MVQAAPRRPHRRAPRSERVGDELGIGVVAVCFAPAQRPTPISVPVKAGKKSSGTYVFTIPRADRGKVAVDVALGTDRDHAQFLGSVG